MNLHETLQLVPYRELRIITKVQELNTSLRPPKKELIEVIEGALLDDKHLRRLLRKLSEDERAALDALIAAEGSLPVERFGERFGEVEPFRPWRKGEPTHPWYSENEPAQQLAYWGLLYLHPRRLKPGQTEQVVMIPADLLALLPPVPSPAQVAATPVVQPISHEQALLFDVTMLLSFVNQEQPKALYKGRWMSRKNTEALNERLMQPDEMTEIRSELQSQRVRFVHFLAESAGLMGVMNNVFTVTPLGWQWLAASKKQQYQQLWQAWQVETSQQGERWKRYRYLKTPYIQVNLENPSDGNQMDFNLPHPPVEEPLKLLQCLLKHLAKCKPQQSYQRSAFLNHLWTIEPEFWRFEIDFKTAIERGWIEEKTSSYWSHEEKPLNFEGWFQYHLRPWNNKASRSKAMPPYLYDFLSQVMAQYLLWWDVLRSNETHFTVTPIGDWLLKGTSTTPPNAYVEEQQTAFTMNEQMIISVPLEAPAETLVRIERIAQRLAHGKYELTAKTLAKGLTEEMTFDQVITFLHQDSQTGLTQSQLSRLKRWHNQMSQVRLQRVTLLRTRNPQQMTEVTRHRNLNKHILETLSSHSVIIDETKIEKISRLLEREGFLLTGIPPQTEFGQRRKRDRNESAYLLYCTHITEGLKQWIDLPHPITARLQQNLEAELDPATRTATEQAAQEALQRLERVMDGYSSRHSWDIKSVPQDQALSLIHQAIKKGHQLQITYYSASRQVRTNRTINPYRLEWSHQTPYLIAYCRHAHAERRFRVDRIEAIQLIPR